MKVNISSLTGSDVQFTHSYIYNLKTKANDVNALSLFDYLVYLLCVVLIIFHLNQLGKERVLPSKFRRCRLNPIWLLALFKRGQNDGAACIKAAGINFSCFLVFCAVITCYTTFFIDIYLPSSNLLFLFLESEKLFGTIETPICTVHRCSNMISEGAKRGQGRPKITPERSCLKSFMISQNQ